MVRRPHWSYSQIAQYQRCPLQYFFQRVAKLPEPFVSSNLVLGSAVHAALAEYHGCLQHGLDCPTNQVQTTFLETWREREERQPIEYRNSNNRAKAVDQGIALLELYLNEPPPENVVGVEQEFVVPLYNSQGEILEKPLVAILDLICENKDSLKVVEFKTSARRFSQVEVAMSLQVTCYMHAINEKYDRPVSLWYKVLVKTKKPQLQELMTERNSEDISRLGDLVQVVGRAIAAKVFYPIENAMNCSTCPYRQPCRQWRGPSPMPHIPDETTISREPAQC